MSVATSTAIAIAAGVGAAGSIGGAALSSRAAGNAANQQAQSAGNALDFQKQVYADQQANQAPYLEAGKMSLSRLMEGFTNGTFGPGSIKPFAAPTAAEAAATPGYQFIRGEGNRGVLAAASAGGRSLSGGTLKALDRYNTGLADSTYGDTFSRALQTYQAQLAGQSQSYNELAGIAGTGQTATQNIGAAGQNAATNVGNLMTGVGNAQAASTLYGANAWNQGINGATGSILQGLIMGGNFGGPSPASWKSIAPGFGTVENPATNPYGPPAVGAG
jgi:hypothetical protein